MNLFEAIPFDIVVRYTLSLVVLIAVLAAILYSIWGGFLIIISAGNEEKVKSAINHIRHATLGVGVLILVLFIAPIIIRAFGLNYDDYLRPRNILSTIAEISARVFGTESSSDTVLPDSNDKIPSNFSDL